VYAGHEFHYSDFKELDTIEKIGKVKGARGQVVEMPVFHQDNILASYMHWYWGEQPKFLGLLDF